MRRTTVTIGIPAYNEELNIRSLLLRLLAQDEDGFRLKDIVVISDGSTDTTVKEASAVKDKRVRIVDDGKRLGKSARLEQLFRMNKADVLLLLDADVVINDYKLLGKFLKRASLPKSGLATANVQPLPSETFFERILATGVSIAKKTAEKWHNGDNYLSFKGCFLALDRRFALQLHMPESIVNNDAYIYFAAKKLRYRPTYVKQYLVYYRSPRTLADHIKQSSRYQNSREELSAHFGKRVANKYKIPFAIMGRSILESMVSSPVFFIAYLGVHVTAKLKRHKALTNTWSIAQSTKQAVIAKPH